MEKYDRTWLTVVVGIGILLTLLLYQWFASWFQWAQTVPDPTERGLAYLTAAVVFHALLTCRTK